MSAIDVYPIDHGEVDVDELEISTETDVLKLQKMFIALDSEVLQMEAKAEGWRVVGHDNAEAKYKLASRIAFMVMARRWVENRLLTINSTPAYQAVENRGNLIRELQAEIERLKKK